MKRCIVIACLVSVILTTFSSDSAGQSPAPGAEVEFMSVDLIKPGMKGYGVTVFEGSVPEKFDVEVLGLLEGVPSPKIVSIIARLGGPRVERSGVFAGMSGSPVYIDGKLIGAVAFTFPFAKEPIAGITPIKSMIDNVERVEQGPQPVRSPVSFSTLTASFDKYPAALGSDERVNFLAANQTNQTLVPIATPVSFAGVPQAIIEMFADELRKIGIQPVTGIAGASRLGKMTPATESTLKPGSSVGVQLVRGDFTIEAAGTVTHRDRDRIYAFGHSFLQSGATSWPMTESSVVTVVPNLNNSFKLSSSGNLVGSISQDRSTGVFGKLGDSPSMIPVRLSVRTSRNKIEVYNFEIVSDSFLTPILTRLTMLSAISGTERAIGNQTITVNGRVKINGQADIILNNGFSLSNGALMMAVMSVERPVAILLNSGFQSVDIRAMDIEVTSSDLRSGGVLSRLWVDKTEVSRGEKIEIQAFARSDSGSEFVERIPIEIPGDAPLGPLVILVGDGASVSQAEMRIPAPDFTFRDLGQLVRAINKLKKNNRLYVKVVRSGGGAIVNNEEMPTLPPSVMATLGSERTSGGYVPLSVTTLREQELPPSELIITGQQTITVTVVK